MLCKIAWSNVRRAGRDYLVYFVTLMLAVMVFYAFNTITVQADFIASDTRELVRMLGGILSGLTVFLAAVMGFLMVYANNYIMKRRKREFGLYQILGMSRGQVSRVMVLETTFVSAGAAVAGLILGMGLSQLMVFFTGAIFQSQIENFSFFVSPFAVGITLACLLVVYLVSLVFNLRVVRRSKLIDLFGAERRGEQVKTGHPLVAAVVFIAGVALIAVSYARLWRDGLPYSGTTEETEAFLITTAMVIVGTLLFFFGLSGFLLKALQGVRGFYYRGLNMFTLRQLNAKVNTVSLSMAVIAMILFLAITSVTGGMSIASSMVENIELHTPADFSQTIVYFSTSTSAGVKAWAGGAETAVATEPIDVARVMSALATDADGQPVDFSRVSDDMVQVDTYDSMLPGADKPVVSLRDLVAVTGDELPKSIDMGSAEALGLAIMRESDYNALMAFYGKEQANLGEDGYLLTCDMGDTLGDIYNHALGQGVELDIAGRSFHPVIDELDLSAGPQAVSNMGSNTGTIVLPDEVVDELGCPLYNSTLIGNYAAGVTAEEGQEYLDGVSLESYDALVMNDAGQAIGTIGSRATRATMYETVSSMMGLISYMAIYIGFVLVVACAAILTIQQLSSVSDGSTSYRILSELGTSEGEIAHSVLKQQAIFFAFPLLMGIAHAIIALKVIIDLVQLFGGISIGSTVGLAVVIFGLAYGGYFAVTYLMSRGIVHDAIRVRKTL